MRRVLMVSPHFPPDTSAAAHRVRLLAPHLPDYGWEPTVVSVEPQCYEGRLDTGLAALVPPSLRVVRCGAWNPRWTRTFGFGDLGVRAFTELLRTCCKLLRTERFDALFVTIYPTYPALLGPLLKRRFGVPFILDYQDPWVSSWGLTVGGGDHRAPDLKSRLTRAAATLLEPLAVQRADAVTAVSAATYEQVFDRHPTLHMPSRTIPLGGEPADFDHLRKHPRTNSAFDPSDGNVHVCYVGTLLPAGHETLRAFLRAAALLRDRQPQRFKRLRIHFFGTSNQTHAAAQPQVLPVAQAIGAGECVTEVPARLDYLDALTVLTQASVILMLGSSEPHYTASKLYPGLLARRPILAVYHEASSVVGILRRAAQPPTVRVVTYDDQRRAESTAESLCDELAALVDRPHYDPALVDMRVVDQYSAAALACSLVDLLNAVASAPTASTPERLCD